MRERLFLCGLTDSQRHSYTDGKRLSLHGVGKNVNLKVQNLRDQLNQVEPEALTDLLEIAAYAFRADNSIPRTSAADERVGGEWRRTFRMVVAVREPGRWSEQSVAGALSATLHFLSDDIWHFEFVNNIDPSPLQYYLGGIREDVADTRGGTSVVLFSGGLDSFAGAVHELTTTNRHVVLASHRTNQFVGKHQTALAGVLKKRFDRRVTHVRVQAGSSGPNGPREHSQRTRSFLFLAVAAVAARIEDSDRIRFYENGIMSANLPISEQVIGTHASRSTHPRSIGLFNAFLAFAFNAGVTVENPFAFQTKFEVVQRLKGSSFVGYIKNTLSCSATRDMTLMHPHCGECKQCIERRLATLGADAADADPGEAYRVELFAAPRPNGIDRAMAVDSARTALSMASMSESEFERHYAGELAWLLSAFPSSEAPAKAKEFHAMFQRHGKRVERIFQDAVIKHRAAIVDKTLPTDSLLWLAIERPYPTIPDDSSFDVAVAVDRNSVPLLSKAREPPQVEEAERFAFAPTELLLLTDPKFNGFRIDGLVPFTGKVTLALLRFLVQEHRKDRNEDREPQKFRAFLGKQLANALSSPSDESVRSLIDRVRAEAREGCQIAHGVDIGENALIESTKQGYRLDPHVRVVAK